MSEPISAFAVYKASAKKGGGRAARKSNQKKNTSGSSAAKKGESKGKGVAKSGVKDKAKTAPAKGKTAAKEKEMPNIKAAAKTAIKAALVAATTAKAISTIAKTTTASPTKTTTSTTKKQTQKSKNPTTSNGRKSSTAAAASKKVSSNITESQVDKLVEELLGVSPKKLTKAQLKKKKDLEGYLVQKVEIMDAEEGRNTVVNGKADSKDGSSSDSSAEDEFPSDYTINSYSDDSDDTSEGEEESDETDSDDDGESESSGSPCDNPNCGDCKSTQATTTTKRKSDGAAATTNGIADAKKPKSVTTPTKSHSTAKRTSLPAGNNVKASPKKIMAKRVTLAESVKLEPLSPPSNGVKMNSITEGMKAFSWLLQPVTEKNFFESYWEKSSLFVTGRQANYFKNLISFETIDEMLLKNHIEFTKNIDITSYKNGVRDTLNPEGRAMPPVVWDFYGQGCSIRLLNPQTYMPALYTLNSTIQEFFHCLVGANAYLTPPNSQGFAPHYDDIEAFVLQIEGRKRWKLYQPFEQEQVLPRFSSRNFEQKEIGKPIFDEVLKPGDMLYFPRGTIHQACTEPGYHSLHITLSVYQKQSYADLFERMMPIILEKAIASSVDMRRGLPLYTFRNAGVAFSTVDTKERCELQQNVTKLLKKCLDLPLDDVVDLAVDQLAKKFQHEALPPEILSSERVRTVYGSRSTVNSDGECICDYDINLRTNVRLLRANILRLVEEEGKTRIYYHLDNSKEYCQYDATFIEIDPIEAGSVEVLLKSYPEYVGVSQLPLPTDDHKIQVATALWERGFLMLEKAFV